MCLEPLTDWSGLCPLPRVRDESRAARNWTTRRDRYRDMDKRPLIVTADLVTPIIHAERDATHLDGVLSFAALTDHPVESHHGPAGVSVVPVPLALAWVSPEGRPLWASTPLVPADRALKLDGREYWHKRYPVDRAEFADRQNAITTAGRWKEYRVPVAAQSVSRLAALCIGHQEEIEKLLAVVTHIGKKGSMGYGRVAKWIVHPGEHDMAQVLALRPVPSDYYAGRSAVGEPSPNRGWTPPYWYAPWWADCVVPA